MDALRQLRGLTARPSEMSNAPKKRREPKFGEVPEEVREYDEMIAKGRKIIDKSVAQNKAAEQEKKDAELRKLFGDYDPNAKRFQPAPAKLKDMGAEPTSGDVDEAIRSKRPEKRLAPGRDQSKEVAGVPFEEALRKKSQKQPTEEAPKETQGPEPKSTDTVSMLPDMKNEERKLLEKIRQTKANISEVPADEARKTGPYRKMRMERDLQDLNKRVEELRKRMRKLGAP